MKAHKALLILASVIGAGSTVYADKVKLNDTPPSVQQAIKAKAGSHEIEDIDRDLRNGQTTYEASWKNNSGVQQEFLVSDTGKVLRDVAGDASAANNVATAASPTPAVNPQNFTSPTKTTIALSETPRAVQAGIYTQIPNAPIDSVQRFSWNGKNYYEASYHENGQAKTYRVDEAGKPITDMFGNWQPRYGMADANLPLPAGEKLAFNQAPRAVQRTMNHVANGAAVENLERSQWNGRTVYASTIRRNNENVQLQVFDDGSIVTKTPGVVSIAANPATPPATTAAPKKQSFFDKAADIFNRSLNQNPAPTQPAAPAVSLADAPRPVQQTVNQMSKGAALQDLQKSQWNGRTLYEAAFQQNGQDMKLQVLDDGSVLSMGPNTAFGAPASSETGFGRR